jgi:hypothetical protein
MVTSYINGTQSQGFQIFKGKTPSIFDIQEYIEHAWDIGINSQGRAETGGIRGTRKYIGTPDVSLCGSKSFINYNKHLLRQIGSGYVHQS